MSAGIEGLTVAAWLEQTVAQDAELAAALGVSVPQLQARVHQGVAPAGTPYPLLTWSVTDGPTLGGVGTTDWLAQLILTVRWVAEGRPFTPLAQPMVRTHRLLTGNHQQPAFGGLVLTGERRTLLQYRTREEGRDFAHLGGVYVIHAQ